MNINYFTTNEKEYVQIYLSKKEKENKNIQKKIRDLKDKYRNVALFIQGKDDTNKFLKNIINCQKEIDIDLYNNY